MEMKVLSHVNIPSGDHRDWGMEASAPRHNGERMWQCRRSCNYGEQPAHLQEVGLASTASLLDASASGIALDVQCERIFQLDRLSAEGPVGTFNTTDWVDKVDKTDRAVGDENPNPAWKRCVAGCANHQTYASERWSFPSASNGADHPSPNVVQSRSRASPRRGHHGRAVKLSASMRLKALMIAMKLQKSSKGRLRSPILSPRNVSSAALSAIRAARLKAALKTQKQKQRFIWLAKL